ncbi:Urease accessory protein UreF [Sulfobacillus acidophilus TPY]|nr:Urease accessory protein UreF [Sulfobacillus acidophilus TPY]
MCKGIDALWALPFWIDSALPTGGFVLSHGLETMVQEGWVASVSDVGTVLRLFGRQISHSELIAFWHVIKSSDGIQALERCQVRLDALVMPDETRQASLWQGQRILSIAEAWGLSVPVSRTYSGPAFAWITRVSQLSAEMAALAYLYRQLSEMASAALRLMRVDGVEVFRELYRLQPEISGWIETARRSHLAQMTTSSVWLEWMALRHQHQEMRLFRT